MAKGLPASHYLGLSSEEFSKLNKAELRKATSVLRDVANKRYRRLEKSATPSAAFRSAKKSGGVFSTKGKNFNQLRSEFIRAKNFLESASSTEKGAKKVVNDTLATLEKSGVKIDKADFNRFFESYEKLKELDPSVSEKSLKYNSMREIASEMQKTNDNPDEIASIIARQVTDIYEAEKQNEFDFEDEFSLYEDF